MSQDLVISSGSGWLTQVTATYTLVQKEDGWVTQGAKYTLGTAAHALETVIALIELVLASVVLVPATALRFLIPKAREQWFDEKIVTPLTHYAVDAGVAMCAAGSRIVTNFTGNAQTVEASLRSRWTSMFLSQTPPNLPTPEPVSQPGSEPVSKLGEESHAEVQPTRLDAERNAPPSRPVDVTPRTLAREATLLPSNRTLQSALINGGLAAALSIGALSIVEVGKIAGLVEVVVVAWIAAMAGVKSDEAYSAIVAATAMYVLVEAALGVVQSRATRSGIATVAIAAAIAGVDAARVPNPAVGLVTQATMGMYAATATATAGAVIPRIVNYLPRSSVNKEIICAAVFGSLVGHSCLVGHSLGITSFTIRSIAMNGLMAGVVAGGLTLVAGGLTLLNREMERNTRRNRRQVHSL